MDRGWWCRTLILIHANPPGKATNSTQHLLCTIPGRSACMAGCSIHTCRTLAALQEYKPINCGSCNVKNTNQELFAIEREEFIHRSYSITLQIVHAAAAASGPGRAARALVRSVPFCELHQGPSNALLRGGDHYVIASSHWAATTCSKFTRDGT